ncbi:MAG: hypothetical protein IPG89_10280 [Bacteroidetes bacterium]|nr:hypothetical protein [Bacteroidota bacterium]
MDERDNEFMELVEKFERTVKNDTPAFFDSEELEEIIEHYFTIFKMDMVKIAMDRALEQYPYSAIFKIFKAQYLSGLHETTEALAILNELELIEPSNSEIYTTRALIYS